MSRPANTAQEARTSVFELGLLLFAASGLLIALATAAITSERGGAVWFSLCALSFVLCIPFFIAVMRGRFDPFEPIYIVIAAYFLYLVYAPGRDYLKGREFFFGREIMPLVPLGSLYAAVGIAAMLFGYYLRFGKPNVGRVPEISPQRMLRFGLAVGVVGILGFTGWIAQTGQAWIRFLTLGQVGGAVVAPVGGESGATNYFLVSVELLLPAFILLYASLKKRRVWLIPAFIFPLLVFTTLGFRYRLLILALAPVVYTFLRRRQRPSVLHATLALAIFIPAVGLIGTQRNAFRGGVQVTREDVLEAESVQAFNNDLDIYQPYLAMIDAMPADEDFFHGRSFTYLLIHPIPRAIWPGKPQSPVSRIILATFRGDNAPLTSGVAYPNFGEFYANFGVPGMIFGMALFGWALRRLKDFLDANRDSPLAMATFAIMLPFLVQIVSRGYLVAMVQAFAFIVAPLIVLRFFPGPDSRSARAALAGPSLPLTGRSGRPVSPPVG